MEMKRESEHFGDMSDLMCIQERSRLLNDGSEIDGAHATQGVWVRFQIQFDAFSWNGETRIIRDYHLINKHINKRIIRKNTR